MKNIFEMCKCADSNGRVIGDRIGGGVGSKTSVYAAKEDERERVIKWAREYRLPLFQE